MPFMVSAPNSMDGRISISASGLARRMSGWCTFPEFCITGESTRRGYGRRAAGARCGRKGDQRGHSAAALERASRQGMFSAHISDQVDSGAAGFDCHLLKISQTAQEWAQEDQEHHVILRVRNHRG